MQSYKKLKRQEPQQQQKSDQLIMNSHLSQCVGFGFGIIYDDQIVSLAKYFSHQLKPGNVYVRKSGLKEPQASTFHINLGEEFIQDYDALETQGIIQEAEDNYIFVKIQLEDEKDRQRPPLISFNNFKYERYASGLAIGIQKRENEIYYIAIPFEMSQITKLNILLSSAVLLFRKDSKEKILTEFVYGFYDILANREGGGEGHFLYEEYFYVLQAQSEAEIVGHRVKPTQSPYEKYPYNSIGLLVIPQTPKIQFGTASFLRSKDNKCRYIITCAHNFYGCQLKSQNRKYRQVKYDFTAEDKVSKYKIKLAKKVSAQPSSYQLFEVENFQIQRVHIPKEYQEYISSRVQNDGLIIKPTCFPQNEVEGEEKIDIEIERFHDIAIAKLKNPLDFNIGFRIKTNDNHFIISTKSKLKLLGFQGPKKNQQSILHMEKCIMNQQKHGESYVRLSRKFEWGETKGWRILKHKLSTLGGNSGSPIYERINEQESYLFGIHTTRLNYSVVTPGKQTTFGYHNYGTYLYSETTIQIENKLK